MNQSSPETAFPYSDLLKVQSEIENRFKLVNQINVSKLKLKKFKAPTIASFNTSGKVNYFINYYFIYFLNV